MIYNKKENFITVFTQ